MIHFLVCLCMLGYYTGLATCALCVLRFAPIVFGEDVVASFGLLISQNLCRYQFLLVGRVLRCRDSFFLLFAYA